MDQGQAREGRGAGPTNTPPQAVLLFSVLLLPPSPDRAAPTMADREAASRKLWYVLDKDKEDFNEVKRLVEEEGADPNWRPSKHITTNIDLAAAWGHVRSLRFLAKHGGDINIQRRDGYNTLHYACYNNRPAAACVVVAFGGDTTAKNVRAWLLPVKFLPSTPLPTHTHTHPPPVAVSL